MDPVSCAQDSRGCRHFCNTPPTRRKALLTYKSYVTVNFFHSFMLLERQSRKVTFFPEDVGPENPFRTTQDSSQGSSLQSFVRCDIFAFIALFLWGWGKGRVAAQGPGGCLRGGWGKSLFLEWPATEYPDLPFVGVLEFLGLSF